MTAEEVMGTVVEFIAQADVMMAEVAANQRNLALNRARELDHRAETLLEVDTKSLPEYLKMRMLIAAGQARALLVPLR